MGRARFKSPLAHQYAPRADLGLYGIRQNLARADGFKRMVEAGGERWPDGWVKGEGFVRPPDVADPLIRPPRFDEIGEEYVRQIVDLSPGQRKRYLGQLQVLARTPVRGSLVFAGPVTAIGEAQLKTWLIECRFVPSS